MSRLMALERPLAGLEMRLAWLLDPPKDKQHRFFLYTRKS